MKETETRYTVTTHHNTFNNGEWYSLRDNKESTDIELDHKCDKSYAIEVCRKFNKEDRAGLHS